MLTKRKIILFVVLLSTVLIVFGWRAIGEQHDGFHLQVKAIVPEFMKPILRDTLFLVPSLRARHRAAVHDFETHINNLAEQNKVLEKDQVILDLLRAEKIDSDKEIKKLKAENRVLDRKYWLMNRVLRDKFKFELGVWERYIDFDRQKVPCPKSANVILVTGQSNSGNFLHSRKYENKLHVNYSNGSCYVLDNPVLGAQDAKPFIGHDVFSIVPAIANKLASKLPYIFLATGWGGPIKLWTQDESVLSNYTNNELKDLEKKGHSLSAVVWMQGESDSEMVEKKEMDYIHHFNKMKSNILRGLNSKQNVKFVITQSSKCFKNPRGKKLNAQQLQLGKDKNTYVTEVTDNLGSEYRWDNCHLNELGVEATAEEISSVLNDILNN